MSGYKPEIGQALFGQPFKQHGVPEIAEAALAMLSAELDRVMANATQKEYDSPFSNTGNSFKNKTFEVRAYSWDESVEQPYHFKWRDIEISWYKYLGRGMSANREIDPVLAAELLMECLASLRNDAAMTEQGK